MLIHQCLTKQQLRPPRAAARTDGKDEELRWLKQRRHRILVTRDGGGCSPSSADRPADDRARRLDREHRAARRAEGAGLLQRRPAVDRHRLLARVRQPAAARRADRRPASAASGMFLDRPDRLRRRPPPSAASRPDFAVLFAARALQGGSRALLAPAALSLRHDDLHRAKERGHGVRRVRRASPAAAPRSACCSAACSPSTLNWRWTLFVNVAIAVIAVVGAAALIRADARAGTGPGSTSPAPCWSRAVCSARLRLRPRRKSHGWSDRRRPRASWSPACCCWSRSSRWQIRRRTRCCRCGWCWTATAAGRT